MYAKDEKKSSELCDMYAPQNPGVQHGPYTGEPNPSPDRVFDEAEIWAALQKLNSRSVPGPDGVTNKTLCNLDESIYPN